MNATPPTLPQPPRRPYPGLPVTQLRVGRVVLLGLAVVVLLVGGAIWLLTTQARSLTLPTVDSTGWPAWMRQAQVYPPSEPEPPTPAPVVGDPNAALVARLAAIQAELERQRLELEALKKRPSGQTVITPPQQPVAKTAPIVKAHASMLFVAHEIKETPAVSLTPEYVLAPGAGKLPCSVETAINSEVEGQFTAKVSTNVYDTATGRHLLVPQGSTILGNSHSSFLLYGNERIPTLSLLLTLPDGRTVELGQSPITDQAGVTGLTGDVDHRFWQLFGAVFIGGALRGGMQALQLELAGAAGAGQVAAGISSVGNQALSSRLHRAIDTRPIIRVHAGQLCNVLMVRPLSLPAMWQ